METITFDQLPQAVSQLSQRLANIENLLSRQQSNSSNEVEELLSVQKTAEFLNLSVPTIYSKVSKGELPVMKRSKRLYFSRAELMEYLKKGRKRTNSEIEEGACEYLKKK